MGSWRNWLAQESYTFKVGGSSPSLPTMKETISDFYGFNVSISWLIDKLLHNIIACESSDIFMVP